MSDETYWIEQCISRTRSAGGVDAAEDAEQELARLRNSGERDSGLLGKIREECFNSYSTFRAQREQLSRIRELAEAASPEHTEADDE